MLQRRLAVPFSMHWFVEMNQVNEFDLRRIQHALVERGELVAD
jgi:hypothetical protein